jgi:hypothetical protein
MHKNRDLDFLRNRHFLYFEIYPSAMLRVVSLSNHLGFEYCYLGLKQYSSGKGNTIKSSRILQFSYRTAR